MEPKSSVLAKQLSAAFKDDNTLNAECRKIATDVEAGNKQLSLLVEELGTLLTNKDAELRRQGVHALSTILSHLPKDFLNSTELHFLLEFYTDRLKDDYKVLSATLQGLLSVLQMENTPTDTFVKLFFEMFQHVQCQTLQKHERRVIYLIFQTVLQSHLEAVKQLKVDFVYGVICSIDGERDPRNLMMLFKMLPPFMKELSLAHMTEEMFEILACYFPVDYNPAGIDDKDITREDLAEFLAPCLYAVSDFAPFCLPMITEKLQSNLKIAKIDSLKLLIISASTFGINGLKPHVTELWSCLKDETMCSDPEVRFLALEAVTKIIQVLSVEASESSRVIDKIIIDVKWTLSDVRLNSYWLSEKILEAAAKANVDSCKQVLRTFIPLGLGQYSSKTSLEEKVIILQSLANFLSICFDLGFSVSDVPELSWTDLPLLLSSELDSTNVEIKIEAMRGLVAQRSFLNKTQREGIYTKLLKEAESCDDALRNASVSCVAAFAPLYPTEVLDVIEKEFKINVETVEPVLLIKRLEALSVIAKVSEIGRIELPKVVDVAVSQSLDLSIAAMSCLNKLISTKTVDFDVHQFLHDCNAIEKLIKIDVEASSEKLHLVSSICRSVVRTLSANEQKQMFQRHADVLEGDISDNSVVFFEAVLIPLSQEIVKDIQVSSFFNELTRLALYSTNSFMRLASCKVISILVHKLLDSDYVENYIKPLKKKVESILTGDESLETKKAAVILHTWLAKSVVICGISGLSQDFLNDQIEFLRLKEVGEIVAEEFRILVNKNEDTFVKENGCRVMFLYKQRIFENVIRESSKFVNEERYNFLTALAIVLEEVPMELLMLHLTQLVPMLAESLTLSESRLLLPMLMSLQSLLKEKRDIFSDEAGQIIPKLLDLTAFSQMKVRIAALECLKNYTQYSTPAVYSFKSDVLDKLFDAIDDRKRLVRKVAVSARSRWFLLEAPDLIKIS